MNFTKIEKNMLEQEVFLNYHNLNCKLISWYACAPVFSKIMNLLGIALPRGGGGYTSICMHIGYVPRERPPFSALNFLSGAYPFHKLPKKSVPEHHHFALFGRFCRSGDHNFQNIFNFNPFIASHGWRSPNAKRHRLAARLRAPARHVLAVPVNRIFTLKTDQARSGARAHFSLCRGTYLPKFGVSNPPPPPYKVSQLELVCWCCQNSVKSGRVPHHLFTPAQ